jgi:hypothetical protein
VFTARALGLGFDCVAQPETSAIMQTNTIVSLILYA